MNEILSKEFYTLVFLLPLFLSKALLSTQKKKFLSFILLLFPQIFLLFVSDDLVKYLPENNNIQLNMTYVLQFFTMIGILLTIYCSKEFSELKKIPTYILSIPVMLILLNTQNLLLIFLSILVLFGNFVLHLNKDIFESRIIKLYYLSTLSIFVLLFLAFSFAFLSTGSIDFGEVSIRNYEQFSLSVISIVVVLFIFFDIVLLGMDIELFNGLSRFELFYYIFCIKLLVAYKLLLLGNKMLLEADPSLQVTMVGFLSVLVPLSILVNFVKAVAKKGTDFKLNFIVKSQYNIALLMLLSSNSSSFESEILFYMISISIASLVINETLNSSNKGQENKIFQVGFNSMFQRDRFLALISIVSIISLVGLPLTMGFSSKYFLLINFFREKLFYSTMIIVFSTILILPSIIDIISKMFVNSGKIKSEIVLPLRNKLVLGLFALLILLFGVYPKIFL
jgi:NADH-quinone oxidoreductase subunit N